MVPLVAHADWSMHANKRKMTVAAPVRDGWRVTSEDVGDLPSLLDRLRARAGGTPVAFGVDAPIGLPVAYRQPFCDFPSFLRSLQPDDIFFRVCNDATEISNKRPFYPYSSKPGSLRQHLYDRLGLRRDDLVRRCERATTLQPGAASLFWTLGANQAGKGAICLWRDLLGGALRSANPPALWPFDGALATLLRPGCVVIAETYPANAMRQMDLGLRGSKRRQADRGGLAPRFRSLMAGLGAEPDPALAAAIDDGFGVSGNGEDQFDSMIGLLRMLQVIRDPALDQLPDPAIRRWEGWILGRPVSTS